MTIYFMCHELTEYHNSKRRYSVFLSEAQNVMKYRQQMWQSSLMLITDFTMDHIHAVT